jgi:hypothetical protein
MPWAYMIGVNRGPAMWQTEREIKDKGHYNLWIKIVETNTSAVLKMDLQVRIPFPLRTSTVCYRFSFTFLSLLSLIILN